MKRDNYTCVGQLSLFDYFKSEEEEILLYDLLPVGTKVWRVVKADILEYEIIDECWQIGDNVISCEEDTLMLVEDYEEDLRRIFGME